MYPAIRRFAKSKTRPIVRAVGSRGARIHRSHSQPRDHSKGTSPWEAVTSAILHVRPRRVRRQLGHVRPDAPPDPRGEARSDPGFQLLRRVRRPDGVARRVHPETGLPAPPPPPPGGHARARPRFLCKEPPFDGWRTGTVGPGAAPRISREPTIPHPVDGIEGSRRTDRLAGAGTRAVGDSNRRTGRNPAEGRSARIPAREGLIPRLRFLSPWIIGPLA